MNKQGVLNSYFPFLAVQVHPWGAFCTCSLIYLLPSFLPSHLLLFK